MQGVGQLQVSAHTPLVQVWPSAQRTPAQGFRTQVPAAQNSVSAQVTSSQGEGGTHWTWHAVPSGHCALQGWTGSHCPELRAQYWPAGHVTLAQGDG